LAVKNSIILAEKYGYRQIAVPFIGSAIFGGTCDRAKLARVVVNSAVNQFKKISFDVSLLPGDDPAIYFLA